MTNSLYRQQPYYLHTHRGESTDQMLTQKQLKELHDSRLGFPSVFKRENATPGPLESKFTELPESERAVMILGGYGGFLVCHPDTGTVRFEMSVGAKGAKRTVSEKPDVCAPGNPFSHQISPPCSLCNSLNEI